MSEPNSQWSLSPFGNEPKTWNPNSCHVSRNCLWGSMLIRRGVPSCLLLLDLELFSAAHLVHVHVHSGL